MLTSLIVCTIRYDFATRLTYRRSRSKFANVPQNRIYLKTPALRSDLECAWFIFGLARSCSDLKIWYPPSQMERIEQSQIPNSWTYFEIILQLQTTQKVNPCRMLLHSPKPLIYPLSRSAFRRSVSSRLHRLSKFIFCYIIQRYCS